MVQLSWWRRGWDSNPRTACAVNGFRDRPVRPLRHLSVKASKERGSPLPRSTGQCLFLIAKPHDPIELVAERVGFEAHATSWRHFVTMFSAGSLAQALVSLGSNPTRLLFPLSKTYTIPRHDPIDLVAERVGFEPTVESPLHTISSRAPSATRSPLQKNCGRPVSGRPAQRSRRRLAKNDLSSVELSSARRPVDTSSR